MRHTQSLLAEMRALEEKRAGAGLTPAEEGRLAELRALGGAPAASRGFDVNAAAAVIREEIVSATPPPVDAGAEPPVGPLQAQGYDEVPAFDAGRAFALDAASAGDPNRTMRWDPAALAAGGFDPSLEPGEPGEPQAAEPDVQPYDPSAPQAYDPSLHPQDPSAQAWDPNAQPYDPNAPQAYDPSLHPQDPSAQAWDPDAQPYDPSAPQAYDPSLYPQDPSAQAWDPDAQPYDPGAPQAYDPSLYPQDPGAQEQAASGRGPETTAEWNLPGAAAPAAGVAAAPDPDTASWDLGRVPPAPSGETGSDALADDDEFRHEAPSDWAGEVGVELLDQLELVSSGSFPPIDFSVLPDAQVELPPVPDEPEGPRAPVTEEPAPLTDVYALAEQAAATEAARAPFDFELPPVTPAEEAILEVGGDVQEVEADDLAGTEPVELVEEVTRPVPEFADPLAEERPATEPHPAPLPAPPIAAPIQLADEETEPAPEPQAPRQEPVTLALDASVLDGAASDPPPPETWEPALTIDEQPAPPPPAPEPPRVLAPPPPVFVPPPPPPEPPRAIAPPPAQATAVAEPPVRPPAPSLPPLVSAFAPPGEPVSLDAIGIEEAPPEAEPAAAPAGARILEGAFRVVLHTVEGQVKRGTLHDPVLDGGELVLEGPGTVERLPGDRIRAIFFMLGTGEKAPEPWGHRVRVTFRDGRQVAGFSPDYDPAAVGFFMVPADTRTNTARIWVYRSAVRQVSVSEPGA